MSALKSWVMLVGLRPPNITQLFSADLFFFFLFFLGTPYTLRPQAGQQNFVKNITPAPCLTLCVWLSLPIQYTESAHFWSFAGGGGAGGLLKSFIRKLPYVHLENSRWLTVIISKTIYWLLKRFLKQVEYFDLSLCTSKVIKNYIK